MNAQLAKLSRTLHWSSSALGLATLLFFSVTGITLNHPDWFEADSQTTYTEITLSAAWIDAFRSADEPDQLAMMAREVDGHWGLSLPRSIERDEFEWALDYQRPGGLTLVLLDLESGILSRELIDDGLVSLINDLHKGRHSGLAWQWLIDIVALLCLFFSVTGLLLLAVHASKRPSTWPLVAIGTVIPLFIFWQFVP